MTPRSRPASRTVCWKYTTRRANCIYTIKPGEREKKLPPGPYKVQVTDAKGLKVDRDVFTIEKGGRVVVHVTLAPPVIAKKNEPDAEPTSTADHRAAKWLLSIGQKLIISHKGEEKQLTEPGQLPKGPFHVVSITLASAGKVKSAELKNLKGLTELSALTLTHLSGETDLAFLKDSKKLIQLDLQIHGRERRGYERDSKTSLNSRPWCWTTE